ncbi:MAG: FtsX-like permease family protein [Lachnospiraceae bacterium]|nr:FtsX-like permease family protein [Lachnospiraceae bacterium]
MNKSMWKTTLREIRASFGRYLAIFAIIALGVGFFSGLKVTKEAMLEAGDSFLKRNDMFDYRLISTLGLTEDDVDVISGSANVEYAYGAYQADAVVSDGENEFVVRFHSLDDRVNTPELKVGRLPEKSGEAVVDGRYYSESSIGKTVRLASSNTEETLEHFSQNEFTVVGIAYSPLYLNYERGTTSVGNGSVSCYYLILPEDFDFEVYTDIYLSLKDKEFIYSEEYDNLIDRLKPVFETALEERALIRYNKLYSDARAELDDAQAELADAEVKLSDAHKELEDGKAEIADKEKELEDARSEIADKEQELEDGEKEIADGEKELADAEKEIADNEAKLADAEKEIADNEAKLADAEKEIAYNEAKLADAEKEIADNETKLADAEKEIADNEAKLADAEKEIADNEAKLVDAEKEIANNESKLAAAQKAISDNESKLLAAENEIKTNEEKLDAAELLISENESLLAAAELELTQNAKWLDPATLASAQAELALKRSALEQSKTETLQGRLELEAAKEQLESGKLELSAGKAEYENGIDQLNAAKSEVANGRKELELAKKEVNDGINELKAAQIKLANGKKELDDAKTEVENGKKELNDAKEKLSDGKKELADAKKKLSDGKKEIKDAKKKLSDGKQELEDARTELEDGRQKLKDAKKEIADGEVKLADARKELTDGETELADKEAEFNDAKLKVSDAEKELADFKEPSTYVLTRDENIGYACFKNDSTIVEGIAVVFPVFFFLVAALVCVTTMSRMIEEQRTQIGILMALGYSGSTIMSKYMIYSGSAAILGCVGGFFLGCYVFPTVIWKVYGLMYGFADINFVFDPVLFIISIIVALLCSVGTTYISCKHDLSRMAAELIRPKSPKSGKRILLERIAFLWRKIPFLHKVSIRNVFRYKGRFIMMLLGIGGCTGLLVTGYGIRDSITEIADEQYTQILIYDELVNFTDTMTLNELDDFKLEFADSISTFMPVCQTSVDPVDTGSIRSVNMMTLYSENDWQKVLLLHDKAGVQLDLPGPGEVILSQNVAKINNVNIGDTITFRDSDFNEFRLKVSGVCENFFNAYAYISAETYVNCIAGESADSADLSAVSVDPADIFGTGLAGETTTSTIQLTPPYKSAFICIRNGTDLHEAAADFMNHDKVGSVNVNSDTLEMFSKMMQTMNYIVVLVIFCAAALAFIVLYNLTNINITERIREIATIKVLGFYPIETAAYVFRENLVLTAFGAVVGIPIGIWLHRYVMSNIKIDMVTFDVHINGISYIYALLFTFAFAVFVDFMMYFKLARINMSESLKSIE